jgi:hypothetical protein
MRLSLLSVEASANTLIPALLPLREKGAKA